MEEREHFSRRVGTTIRDKWHLDALLGVGGMAAVYAATHKIGRREALKILHPEIARNKDLRVRFEREARAVNQFQHPGVVEIRDIDVTEDGAPFLVMEFLEGENLADLAKRQNGIETGEMLRIMDDLLDVLVAAHARNIVHRDIKLDNLFLLTDSRLKVLDFGIARMRTDRDIVTRTGATLGTVAYMPPEQVKGLEIDARADLFAVGATMFRLVARRRIHDARSEAEMLVKMATEPAPALLEVAPDASRGLAQVVDRALAFERERRYPDALTMQGDVRALREGREPPYAAGRLAAGDDPRDKRPIEGSGLANVAAGLGGAAGLGVAAGLGGAFSDATAVAPPSTAGPSSVVAMEPTSLGEPSGPPSYAGSPMSLGDPTVASTPSAIGSSPPTSVGAAMGLAESPAPPSIESGPIASGPIASGPVGSGPVGSGPVGFAPAATLPGAALTAAPSSRGGGATPWIAAALAGAVLVGAVFGLWMVMGDDASAEDAEVATDDGDDDDDDDDDRARGAAGEDDETEGSGRSRGLPSALRGEPGPGVERPGTEPGPGDPDAPRPGGLVPPPPPDPADPPPAKRGDPPPPPPPAAPSKTASPRDPPPPKAPSPKPEDDKKSTGKPDKREGDGKGKGKGKKK